MNKNKTTTITGNAQSKIKNLTLLGFAPLPSPEGFEEAAGPLAYQMTNDAMFHIVFEACPDALKALISALLRLPPDGITSIEVTNPVTYDFSVYSDEYLKIKPAIQIGILDFELAPDDTSFYSSYYMLNEVTYKKYSDNLRLSVLQLRQAANATEEDKIWHIDLWAQFFKASTWEEVFMVAEKDPYIANTAKTLYRASADERVRALCEGRERGELTMRTLQLEAKQMLEQQLQQQKQQYEEKLQQQETSLRQYEEENARLRAELASLKQQA